MAAAPPAQRLPEPTYETDWVTAVEPVNLEAGNRVTFLEWHPQHPGGEALIVPGKVQLVSMTPAVIAAIRMLQLRLADPPAQVFADTPHVGVPPPQERAYPPVPQATAQRHRGAPHQPEVVYPAEEKPAAEHAPTGKRG